MVIVDVDGEIYQLVDDRYGAYHSGNGQWREFDGLNKKSIGIENVNTGSAPFSESQVIIFFNTLTTT